jgi:hypothetical protein
MSGRTFILVGGPDSGKTNYIARLWEAIRSKTGALIAPFPPKNIEFVEEALEHLLKGEFAPRSNPDVAESTRSFEVSVRKSGDADGPLSDIVVPDVTGELWKKTLETYEIPQGWLDSLKSASGALLLVREGSDQNEAALDWVTCAPLLRRRAKLRARHARDTVPDAVAETMGDVQEQIAASLDTGENGREEKSEDGGAGDSQETKMPTQIALCEFLRFLEFGLKRKQEGSRQRVAVLVTAWDRLDKEKRVQGPMAYIRTQFPMFAGRLEDIETLEVRAFGVSVVSGDLEDPEFKAQFYDKGLNGAGYVVTDEEPDSFSPDLTLPVSWVMKI